MANTMRCGNLLGFRAYDLIKPVSCAWVCLFDAYPRANVGIIGYTFGGIDLPARVFWPLKSAKRGESWQRAERYTGDCTL